MSNAVLSRIARPEPPFAPGANNLIAGRACRLVRARRAPGRQWRICAATWNAAAADLHRLRRSDRHLFRRAYWFSSAFRAFVLGLDLRLATAIQAWRFAGLGFIALYTYGVLPGMSAWPAGLGDTSRSALLHLGSCRRSSADRNSRRANGSSPGTCSESWTCSTLLARGRRVRFSRWVRPARLQPPRWRSCHSCWSRRFSSRSS